VNDEVREDTPPPSDREGPQDLPPGDGMSVGQPPPSDREGPQDLPPGDRLSVGQPPTSGDRPSGAQETRAEAFMSGGAYGALAVAGAVLGVFGSFYQGVEIGPIPVLAIAFSLLNLGAFRLAGWAMGVRLGALVPAVGWLVAVIFMSSKRPEGDLVITATTASYIFLIGGSVAALAAIALTRSPRNWLLPNP
jgi:hypothetical protein